MNRNKTFYHIAAAVLPMVILTLVASCYDDKGNYDYHPINEISVDTSAEGTYYAVDRFDTLHIEPKLVFTQGEADPSTLDFKWELYRDDWATSDEVAEVIST